jgi:hypothetical protein
MMEKIKDYCEKNKEKNKTKRIEYNKKYNEENKEKIAEYNKKYYEENKSAPRNKKRMKKLPK